MARTKNKSNNLSKKQQAVDKFAESATSTTKRKPAPPRKSTSKSDKNEDEKTKPAEVTGVDVKCCFCENMFPKDGMLFCVREKCDLVDFFWCNECAKKDLQHCSFCNAGPFCGNCVAGSDYDDKMFRCLGGCHGDSSQTGCDLCNEISDCEYTTCSKCNIRRCEYCIDNGVSCDCGEDEEDEEGEDEE